MTKLAMVWTALILHLNLAKITRKKGKNNSPFSQIYIKKVSTSTAKQTLL